MPPRYEKTVAFRIDAETEKMIREAWKRMRGYTCQSEVLRDLVRIGAAIILSQPVELESGTVINLHNVNVQIRAPPLSRKTRKSMNVLTSVYRRIKKIAAKLSSLRFVSSIDETINIRTPSGSVLRLNRENFVKLIREVYDELGEIMTMIEAVTAGEVMEQGESREG